MINFNSSINGFNLQAREHELLNNDPVQVQSIIKFFYIYNKNKVKKNKVKKNYRHYLNEN